MIKQLRLIAGRLIQRRRFAVERALLAGRHQPKVAHSSIIHFTLNRAGSQYVKSLLRRCAREVGLTPVDLTGHAHTSSFPYPDQLSATELQQYTHVFQPRGYLYSAFHVFVNGIPNLDRFRVLLVIRDPRDVLTSRYYSDAFSHGRPPEIGDKHIGFDENRTAVRATGIDSFVLAATSELKPRYQQYIDHLVGREYVCVTRYEDMVANFEAWLERVTTFCGLTISPGLRSRLIAEAARATPGSEDIYRHVRRRLPGDHAAKLAPATIDKLNAEWQPILEAFGYSAQSSAGTPSL